MASKKPTNKSQYIRDHSSLSPAEIVAKAKKEGIALTPQFVYSVRNSANKAKRSKAPSTTQPHVLGLLEEPIRKLIRDEIRAFFANR
jgi:hypothetical protein